MPADKRLRQSVFSLLVACLFLLPRLSESCMSCFHPGKIPPNHNAAHHHHSHAITVAASSRGMNPYYGAASRSSNSMALATTAAKQVLDICKKRCLALRRSICAIPQQQQLFGRSIRLSASAALVAGGMVVLARRHVPPTMRQIIAHQGPWRNQLADGQNDMADDDSQAGNEDAEPRTDMEQEEPALSSAMIATIGVYKNFISPLLPPACRFVPTCSQYGVQAIKEFGPSKGVILTSWRLLRCTPFGGKGYDPPKWPPVSYTYSSGFDDFDLS